MRTIKYFRVNGQYSDMHTAKQSCFQYIQVYILPYKSSISVIFHFNFNLLLYKHKQDIVTFYLEVLFLQLPSNYIMIHIFKRTMKH